MKFLLPVKKKFKSFGNKQKRPDKETCSRIEQQSVIKFLVAERCKAVEIHRRTSTVFGAHRWAQVR